VIDGGLGRRDQTGKTKGTVLEWEGTRGGKVALAGSERLPKQPIWVGTKVGDVRRNASGQGSAHNHMSKRERKS